MGTALDALYEYGITELFFKISTRALSTYGIKHKFVHLDTTSFSLQGEYDNDQNEKMVKITKGYSKDNNPDLNQVVLSLICSYKSSIPTWLEVLSGNSSDKKSFKETIQAYKQQFAAKDFPYMVADSALYTKDGISELSKIKWVTRVPETLKEAKMAIEETMVDKMIPARIEGYKIKAITIEGKGRYEKKGRPGKEDKPSGYDYLITGYLEIKPEAVGKDSKNKGFFIIATNELSEEKISDEQLLSVYKTQGISVERGFRFLKDPLFFAESFYLKSEKRIMALLMIMGLSLLVYSLAEKELRRILKKSKITVSNQKRQTHINTNTSLGFSDV